MSRSRHLPRASASRLQEFILNHLAKAKNGRESISFLINSIRDEGIHFETRLSFAEEDFKVLGFRLERERNKYGAVLRTYVTL